MDHRGVGHLGRQPPRPFLLVDQSRKKQLDTEVSKWERLSAGVNLVLERT